jgi:hypothetical protein
MPPWPAQSCNVGHEPDQRHLAHVGAFPRHVGPGDDEHPLIITVHDGVVGTKAPSFSVCSTTGWRPSRMVSLPSSVIAGRT